MRAFIRQFLWDQTGATAIEYAMVASLIAMAIVGGVSLLGQTVKSTLYDRIAGAFE